MENRTFYVTHPDPTERPMTCEGSYVSVDRGSRLIMSGTGKPVAAFARRHWVSVTETKP